MRLPPLLRQLRDDPTGRGAAARSQRSEHLRPRTAEADTMVKSVCPYCAVGCGQRVYVKDGKVTQIEGDPDSPISRGRLCPKGSASEQLVNQPGRLKAVRYRRPGGTEWEELELGRAMEMIADRVLEAREAGWQEMRGEEQQEGLVGCVGQRVRRLGQHRRPAAARSRSSRRADHTLLRSRRRRLAPLR